MGNPYRRRHWLSEVAMLWAAVFVVVAIVCAAYVLGPPAVNHLAGG